MWKVLLLAVTFGVGMGWAQCGASGRLGTIPNVIGGSGMTSTCIPNAATSSITIGTTTATSGTPLTVLSLDGSATPKITDNASFIANYSAIAAPSAPVITHSGTAGAATWGYKLVGCLSRLPGFTDGSGTGPCALYTASSAAGTTTTGNATLTAMNFNIVTSGACGTGVVDYDVYRSASGGTPTTTGLLGSVACSAAFNDTGLAPVPPFSGFTTIPDGSIGMAGQVPYVNQTVGSCFGSYCQANNDKIFAFAHSGTGFSVLQDSAAANFDAIAFYTDLIVDSGVSSASSQSVDMEIRTAQNSPGGTLVGSGSTLVFNTGATATESYIAGSFSSLNLFSAVTSSKTTTNYYAIVNGTGGAVTGGLSAYYADQSLGSATTVDVLHSYYAAPPVLSGGSTITTIEEFYSGALGGLATNPYHLWFDEAGVYRVRADNTFNAVYQAIPTLYNPQFTKYTPGAANFERCIPGCQWESNVAIITPEAGGTGTLRPMRLGDASVSITSQPINYIATESGVNNAIAGTLTGGPALAAGISVCVKLAHSMQAGANTFAYNGGGAVNVKSHLNVANNIGTAYASTGTWCGQYDGTEWVDLSE